MPKPGRKISAGSIPLFLSVSIFLSLLLLGVSHQALARDPLIAYSQYGASVNDKLYYSNTSQGTGQQGLRR
jgi:hypothetical protein